MNKTRLHQAAFDLAVAYRVYPEISKEPFIFQDDKLKLMEICLKSFKKSLASLRVKMFVLLDSCPEEYEDLFRKYFLDRDLEFLKFDKAGNANTFIKQIEILCEQTDSDVIYFAEDDYLYIPHQFHCMIDFLKNKKGVDFVSPYDHPDYYNIDLHRRPYYIDVFSNLHWRTACSTCLTFLTRKSTLIKTRDIFTTYSKGNYDSSLWISLTKCNIFNFFKVLKSLFFDLPIFKIYIKAWLYCWRQILFGKKWQLWVPIPSLATHMEKRYLAPVVDWSNIVPGYAMRSSGVRSIHE
ncbi:MAG: glycosyltransferase family 2 protein [bacterium]